MRMKSKICSKCKVNKPHSEYFKDKKRKIGIRCKCKKCCSEDTTRWREKNRSVYNNYAAMWRAKNPEKQHSTEIKRRYGLSKQEYETMLLSQNMRCKICNKIHDWVKKKGYLFVDHCHETNKVRGLLCHNCNVGLGNLQENIEILKKAIEYLS